MLHALDGRPDPSLDRDESQRRHRAPAVGPLDTVARAGAADACDVVRLRRRQLDLGAFCPEVGHIHIGGRRASL